MTTSHTLAAIASLPVLLAPLAGPAHAAVIYSYAGGHYVSIQDTFGQPTTVFDTTMSVSGSFMVAEPVIAPTLTDISGSVQSYSFSDGAVTLLEPLTDANSNVLFFEVRTDLSGAILEWTIRVSQGSTTLLGGQFRRISTARIGSNSSDAVFFGSCNELNFGVCDFDPIAGAQTTVAPGTWHVPEPSILPWVAIAWMGLAGLGWGRRQGMGD